MEYCPLLHYLIIFYLNIFPNLLTLKIINIKNTMTFFINFTFVLLLITIFIFKDLPELKKISRLKAKIRLVSQLEILESGVNLTNINSFW